jgi:hypothetical protein
MVRHHAAMLKKLRKHLTPTRRARAREECFKWLPIEIIKAQKAAPFCEFTNTPTAIPTSVPSSATPTLVPTPAPTAPPTLVPTPAPTLVPTPALTTATELQDAKWVAELANQDLNNWKGTQDATMVATQRSIGMGRLQLIGHTHSYVRTDQPTPAPTEWMPPISNPMMLPEADVALSLNHL